MRSGWKVLAAAALALPAAPAMSQEQAPAPAAASAESPRPAIWLLEDADTKIYLFGTFHILSPGLRWRTHLLDDIVRRADELVVEVTEADAQAHMGDAIARIQLGKQAPILWRVSPGRRQALAEMVESLGLPIEALDGLQTWAVAITLSVGQVVRGMAREQGAEADSPAQEPAPAAEPAEAADGPERGLRIAGAETVLEAAFRANGRPISAVETVDQQIAIFGSMRFADQRRALEALIDAYRKGRVDQPVDTGESAWAAGNIDGIALDPGAEAGDPFYQALLPRRNAAWTEWLAERLRRPGTVLFAVGAAHLAGPDSVQAMLDTRGLRARRIQ